MEKEYVSLEELGKFAEILKEAKVIASVDGDKKNEENKYELVLEKEHGAVQHKTKHLHVCRAADKGKKRRLASFSIPDERNPIPKKIVGSLDCVGDERKVIEWLSNPLNAEKARRWFTEGWGRTE